ncbi:MAG: amino acid ABC transporter substrate-binding protein [Spirochaetaceae bacterium]|jgi:polar amino acid transport system substrate-binding protein|nr:amino acid ABC transporter substrate-binding protein [Spirochaetaceae bacterium]
MKKFTIIYVCAVLIAAFMLVSCKKTDKVTTDESLKKVLDEKRFVLGMDDSFPPMGFRDAQNNIVGYDIDLATEVCRRLNVELIKQPIDWNAKEEELNTGEIDCIWNGFTITEDRRKAILYTQPYLRNAQVVVVNGASPVQTLLDLSGKTVGTQKGSSSLDAIEKHPEFKKTLKDLVQFNDFLAALMDLKSGGLDAVIIDVVIAQYNITQSGEGFRILGENLGDEEFGIGFRKGDKALEEKVWSTLLDMAKDGTAARITEKWFGSDISVIETNSKSL